VKHKKHDKLVKDYDKQKSEHLDKLATKMLKNDERNQKLKEKTLDHMLITGISLQVINIMIGN
jgi:hypothetical protein